MRCSIILLSGVLAMTADPVVILSYARTPMGSFQGALAGASATELGATAVKAAVERAGVAPEQIDKIFMGCVLPAGLGQAPARQAAIGARACRPRSKRPPSTRSAARGCRRRSSRMTCSPRARPT
jgi:hypothetical protein